ncbi:MAG TPA: hypothetical protein VHO67_13230 [Polyangia bacterium]|nr:hypothetical protein [Polyangia bacterium]
MIVLLLAGAAHGQPAASAPDPLAQNSNLRACLEWDPGPSRECPSREAMQAAIADVLGRPFVSQGTCETTAMGAIRAEAGGGWRVDIQFAGRDGESLGERSLEAPEGACAALAEPLSFVIALMVEGNQPSQGQLHAAPLHLSSIVARPAGGRDATATASAVFVGGAVSSGLLPHAGFGVDVGLASRAVAGLPLRLETTFWFPATQSSSPGGQFWAWEGGVGVCPSIARAGRFELWACVDAVGGVVRGVGLGLDEVQSATRPFAAGEGSVTVSARLSRQVSGYVTAGVALPWLRSRFVYEDATDAHVSVHEPHALIPVGGLGVELGARDSAAAGGGR